MTSFSDFDFVDFFENIASESLRAKCEEAIEDTILEQLGKLQAIEEFAEYHGLIASESELSERFDDENEEWLEKMHLKGDQVAISEAFNNWSDSMCKDGSIHDKQYHEYCYVGKYSKE